MRCEIGPSCRCAPSTWDPPTRLVSSEVIRGHQWPSEVISGHQRSHAEVMQRSCRGRQRAIKQAIICSPSQPKAIKQANIAHLLSPHGRHEKLGRRNKGACAIAREGAPHIHFELSILECEAQRIIGHRRRRGGRRRRRGSVCIGPSWRSALYSRPAPGGRFGACGWVRGRYGKCAGRRRGGDGDGRRH